jgi:hypothetical protein
MATEGKSIKHYHEIFEDKKREMEYMKAFFFGHHCWFGAK